jgi:hypothetical protein
LVIADGQQAKDINGVPETRQCILPLAECEVLDTWYTTGLRGTGSNDLSVKGIYVVGTCVEVVQLIYKAAGGTAVYQKGPLDRCRRDVLSMNQHVIGTIRTYEMAGRLLLGLEPLRWLF